MGCAGSKLDDLQAVALCRERSHLLESAIHHRYSLAQAHLSYLHSLKSVASSLKLFFDLDHVNPSPSSPYLPLPTQRKGDPDPDPGPGSDFNKPSSSSPIPTVHHSHSNSSGSHLHFHSDSDSDGFESGNSSPLHDHHPNPTIYYTNYARSSGPTPSIAYEQRPQNPETVYMGGSLYPNPNPNPNPDPYSSYYPSYPYSNSGGTNGYFGSSSSPPTYSSSPPAARAAESSSSSSAQPPPPPPPPSGGFSWDFLNPFQTPAQYYPSYTPSRESREVREEEGIPDLEDEEYQHEVVKEAYGEQKFVAVDSGGGGYSKVAGNEESRGIDGEVVYGMRSSGVGENGGVEYEVHMVNKNVVANEEPTGEGRSNVAPFKPRRMRGVSEVVNEIKAQFDRASDSGSEVLKILEVGKLPYHRRNAVYKVTSKMLDVIIPLSTSKGTEALPSNEKDDSLTVDFDVDMMMKSKSLSSTLEKLYIWEKKLYEEVKVEEKMRITHERKCRRLKHLDERGAEAHKIESTRTLVGNLSTKIRIALQFVDSISNRINKLRDEDLWPQIDQLIQGLLRMWKVMLECHQSQCQIITEASNLDAVASGRKLSDAHMAATMQLEEDLLNWILSFYTWISAQKSYVKALNGWLLMFIHYVPEETPDGFVPFSPGRIGAPPVFVICNHWSQVMDRISDHEVFEAMQTFSVSVLHLWDIYNLEQRQRMVANKDMDNRLKLEREEQKMQKALDVVNKKLALVSEQNGLPPPGQIVHQSHGASASNIQSGLKHIFEAMERFSDTCMKAYEELHSRNEEVRLSRENAKVP